ILEVGLGLDGKCGVPNTEPVHARRVTLGIAGRRWIGTLEQVERVAEAAQRHEHTAVVGILLEQLEAEDAGIEVLRPLDVAHRDRDMAQALQLDHRHPPWIRIECEVILKLEFSIILRPISAALLYLWYYWYF